MKRSLLGALFTVLAVASASATQFWYDAVTNYTINTNIDVPTLNFGNGGITTNTSSWYPHAPGSLTAHDLLITTNSFTSGAATSSRRFRVAGNKTEYIMRAFTNVDGTTATNSVTTGVLYYSYIASCSFVTAGGQGVYFSAFNDFGTGGTLAENSTNGFNSRGRVFQIGLTNYLTNTLANTFRYGIANAAGDPAQGGSASILYPPNQFDLVRSVDYQIVVKYIIDDGDPTHASTAYMWINPASESDTANMAGPTADAGTTPNGLGGLIFRQRTGGGTADIRDIVVGTTFADVMTNVPGPVLIATNYNTVTNYSGNPALLEVFPTSIGGGVLTYQWYQISGGVTNAVPGANQQTYFIPSTSGSDNGNYFCAVTNSGGIGALSRTNFYISVNATPTAPFFTTKPPAATSIAVGNTLTINSVVSGTGPLSYQWYFNGNPLTDGQPVTGNAGDISVVAGSQTATLTVSLVSTNEQGNFSVTITGAVTPATNAVTALTVTLPATKTIAFLRSLLNTSTWQPTDTTTPYSIVGVVTTTTNLTTGTTSSYYVQDSTAGINLFITGDATFRPTRGDLVTAIGTLSSFNNSLELAVNSSNPYQSYSILSHNNIVPAPAVFFPGLTNVAGLMETNFEGRFVMMTNVFFPSDGTAVFPGGNVIVTNQSGVPFTIFISSTCPDIVGLPMPRFASSVLGALSQFQSGSYASAGYELNVTDLRDVITTPPSAVTAEVTLSGKNAVLKWTAVPYDYSYSVYSATDPTAAWKAVITGLTFTNASGTYTDVNAVSTNSPKFYRVQTP